MKIFLIIVIVILSLAILGGGYFIVRETLLKPSTTPTPSISKATPSVTKEQSAIEKTYSETKEVEAKTAESQTINNEIKPVLAEVFNNKVKLREDKEGTVLVYVVDREIKPEDVTAVKSKLEAKGYAASSATETRLNVDKAGKTIVLNFTTNNTEKAEIEVTL